MQTTNPKMTCPYTGNKVLCSKNNDCCPKWVYIQGKHPQTGENIDEWMCQDSWSPFLIIENSKFVNEIGAAIESLRNEIVRIESEKGEIFINFLRSIKLIGDRQ